MFYISQNEEWYSDGPYETEEEAIAEGRACWSGESFFIGQREDYVPWSRNFVDEFLENEANDVCDECGSDAADNWPPRIDLRSEECRVANEKIAAILKELCGEPSVFKITHTRKIDSESE